MRWREISESLRLAGGKARRKDWKWSPLLPDMLIFVPGRMVTATFGPTMDALGEGRNFQVADHFDAIYSTDATLPRVVVGFTFSQEDILADDWEIVR